MPLGWERTGKGRDGETNDGEEETAEQRRFRGFGLSSSRSTHADMSSQKEGMDSAVAAAVQRILASLEKNGQGGGSGR